MTRKWPYSATWVAVLLWGCAGGPAPPVNLVGYSAAFKQGYVDGCDSTGAFGQRREERRYKTDADYRAGWDDGFSACGRGR